jgi:hypothetical protein
VITDLNFDPILAKLGIPYANCKSVATAGGCEDDPEGDALALLEALRYKVSRCIGDMNWAVTFGDR